MDFGSTDIKPSDIQDDVALSPPASGTMNALSPYAALRGLKHAELVRGFHLYILEQNAGDVAKASEELGLSARGFKVMLANYRKAGHDVPVALKPQKAKPEKFMPALQNKVAEYFSEGLTNAEIADKPEFSNVSARQIGGQCKVLKLDEKFPLAAAKRTEKAKQAKPKPARTGESRETSWTPLLDRLEKLYRQGLNAKQIAADSVFIKAGKTQGAVAQKILSQGLAKKYPEAAKAIKATALAASIATRRSKPRVVRIKAVKPRAAKTEKIKLSPKERGQRALASSLKSGRVSLRPGSAMPPRALYSRPLSGQAQPYARPVTTSQPFTASPRSLTAGLDMEAEMARLKERRQQQLQATLATFPDAITQTIELQPAARPHTNDGPVQSLARQLKAQGFLRLARDVKSNGANKQSFESDYYWHEAGILADIARGTRMEPSLRMHVQLIQPNNQGAQPKSHSPLPTGGRYEAACSALGGEKKRVLCVSYEVRDVEHGLNIIASKLNESTLMLKKMAVPPRTDSCGLITFKGSTHQRNLNVATAPEPIRPYCFDKTKANFIGHYP